MKGKKIILVEDEVDLLRSVTLTLKRAGYEVVSVDNGADALALIMLAENESKAFDLLVTDLHLPGLTGLELVEKIRKLHIPIPVAAITAFGNSQIRSRLKELDCLFCLDKPFNIEELLNHVSSAIKGAQPTAAPPDRLSLKTRETGKQ